MQSSGEDGLKFVEKISTETLCGTGSFCCVRNKANDQVGLASWSWAGNRGLVRGGRGSSRDLGLCKGQLNGF